MEPENITIDSDVPVPKNIGRNRGSRFPFTNMRVGDSIALDNEKELVSARNAAYNHRKKNQDWNYATIKYPDGSGRLWRTK